MSPYQCPGCGTDWSPQGNSCPVCSRPGLLGPKPDPAPKLSPELVMKVRALQLRLEVLVQEGRSDVFPEEALGHWLRRTTERVALRTGKGTHDATS